MEVPTPQPVEKNVFKRLFKDRNADARMNSMRSSVKAESQKKVPHKAATGRQVSSKFSASKENQPLWSSVRKVANAGPKQDTQGLHVSKKFGGLKTPATTSRLKQPVEKTRTPPTVRFARTKLQSARYWLSLVDVAEKAGKHEVSMKLFELALECGAQPAADLHRSWTAYKNRYQIPTEAKDGASEAQIVQCDAAPVGTRLADPEIRSMVKAAACDTESEITNVVTIKNLYAEAYSQVSSSSLDSEVVDISDTVTGNAASHSPPKLPSSEAAPPRRTPRRACALRAALRLEESAKKSTRRKARKNDAAATTSSIADVENMDVSMLMKEVVSGMLSGAQPEPSLKGPVLKSAKKAQQPTATAAPSPTVKVGPGSDTKSTKRKEDAFPVVNEAVKPKWTRAGAKEAKTEAGQGTVTGAQCGTPVAWLGTDDKDRKAAKQSETPVGTKSQVKKAAAPAPATTSEATPDRRRSARLLRSTTASRGSSHD